MSTERCYTPADICAFLKISPRTFRRMRKQGRLPFLEELKPSTGERTIRFRAEPVDRYLAGEWGRPRLVFGRRAAR